MSKIYFNELKNHFNEDITIEGFVDSIRDLQYVAFIVLRDSTDKVQVTVEKEGNDELVNIVSNMTLESTVKITGKLLESPKVKLNGMELIPTSIEITSTSLNELPIDIKKKDNALRETRLDYRFLDLRRDDNYKLFKYQTFIEKCMREFWYNNDYIEIHSPKIAGAAAEGGAELFKLDYFGQPAVLSQSPQIYKQMAMASGFNKVFEISQVYRAENSHTSYHATEIEMVDSEIAWISSHHDVMDMEEAWLRYIFTNLKEQYGEEINNTFGVEVSDVTNQFPRITFNEAKQILSENYHYIGENKEDFERKEEMLICKYVKEKYNSDFVFVTDYPYSARPFYTMKSDDGMTKSFDLLYRGIEITSGAQREHRYEVLKQQIIEKGIDPDTMKDYLSFFQYGMPPHGGFGFGMARLIMEIFNIDNVREATFIYRGPTRLNP